MIPEATRALVRQRLADEVGRIDKDAPFRVALAYPSPYHVGMSSLGYQRIYRAIQEMPGVSAERVFLSDGGDAPGARVEAPVSYEALRPLDEFPVVALSVAYELEIAGVVKLLDAAKIAPLASERGPRDPFVLAGGPLTFSNPVPLCPFVDALIVGEAEGIVEWVLAVLRDAASREEALRTLATHEHVYVPSVHGRGALPKVAACDDALLPAYGVIRTPHTELSNMFLIEAERGCSRGCTYCVMRRSTNGGMRIVPKDVILGHIPADARKVGLVGAAVSDHPKIVEIVRALAERGCTVGLSSLRPDRLKEEFVEALRLAGYKTLTTALDGASERMRGLIERRGREPHYQAAAERARRYGFDRLKLYLMLGLPGETDDDVDECARFITELSKTIPVALGVAPFCAKRKTPLDGEPFAGIDVVEARIARLRSGLRGRADVRSPSARWAWVEYALAQGDEEEGLALYRATRAGGRFADFRRELEKLGYRARGPTGPRIAVASAPQVVKAPRGHLPLAPS